MSRRSRRLPFRVVAGRVAALLVAAFAIYTALTAINFLVNRDYLPAESVIADVDVSGMTIDEAITRTAQTLASTVTVRYQGASFVLEPASIRSRLDEAALQGPLETALAERASLAAFQDRVLRRAQPPIRLDATMRVDEERLREFLRSIAQKHDAPATPGQLDPVTLQRSPGAAGAALNLSDAQRQTMLALASGYTRTVDLMPDIVPAEAPSLRGIEPIVRDKLTAFATTPRVAGVYVKDLQTGDELAINGDVAFSAPGWLRWAVALEAVRTSGGGGAINLDDVNGALGRIGNGDAQAGAEQVTTMLREVGLINTFVAQPYGRLTRPPGIVTPANARGDIDTRPDPTAQSTPVEVGLLLEMIEQCRLNTGTLILLYPGLLTPASCAALLDAFAQGGAPGPGATGLIDAVSPGSAVIQRQSWDAKTHGAAALVRSPARAYVIVVLLHGDEALNWGETSAVIGEVARVAYALYNSAPPPAAPIAAPPPP